MAQYSVNWSATLSSAVTSVAVGTCLVASAAGYLPGTSANRGTKRCSGIAATAGGTGNLAVVMIECGVIDVTISGLAAGTQSWVRVSSAGALERCTPAPSDDIVGRAEADGSVHLHFGTWDSTNAAPSAPPSGTVLSAMTDADYTVPASEFAYDEIEVTVSTVLGADRKFLLPTPATDAGSSSRTIRNLNGSVSHSLLLYRADGAGATVTLEFGKTQRVRVRPSGVYAEAPAI